MTAIIRRSFRYLGLNGYMALYFALVRSILEFASCTWNPHLRRDIVQIERVQRRFTKMLPGMSYIEYEQRLQRLQLQSLERRRYRADLIMTYKILHGFVALRPEDIFAYAGNFGTRGHSLKLGHRKRPRRDVRKFCFENRVISPWNNLPASVVTAPSVASFKARLHSSGALI